jgi:hypothetical protein
LRIQETGIKPNLFEHDDDDDDDDDDNEVVNFDSFCTS